MGSYETALADPTIDSSTTTTSSSSGRIDNNNRSDADADLYHYMNSLMVQYTLNETQYNRMQDLFNSAVYYIANTDMTIAQLETYVASVKSEMTKVATTDVTAVTSEFLQVADNWATPSVSYGQSVSIVLPIINLGTEELNDLVIEPEVSNDVTKWPFVPDKTGYVQTEPYIPGYVNDQYAFDNRREFTYHFQVRDDVMTGYYELKFKISYTRAGVRVEDDNAAELSVFIHTYGKPESGYIGGNGKEDKQPKSRIIVTGYETDPNMIYSGDTFNLTIHLQNTSTTTAVSNILFELAATGEITSTSSGGNGGSSSTTSSTVSPFLPTSGSSSIYVTRIGPGETTDLNIEMSAKSGLSQKSYVLGVNMTYDSGTQFDLTGTANISIPIYQESKFDTSTVEVAPASINVGSQSNLMFSIYNIGKTDLYNVQVQFEADSIENNMAFVGNLASGATGNVDVMLTGVSPTMDDGTIKIKISYEDEAGNVTEVDKSANLYVNEIMMEEFDDMGESGRRDGEESESGGNKGAIIRGLIIGLVALAVIGGGIFLSVRKKKKREAFLHEEDLRDLEELEAEEEKVSDNASVEDSSDDKASDNNGASGNSDGV
ncbi:MAG: hypothetical protein K6G12_11550 [Lachnospiraceae bacterium]|nr:hypothetical protein [Lachnospiraceae bacterium]